MAIFNALYPSAVGSNTVEFAALEIKNVESTDALDVTVITETVDSSTGKLIPGTIKKTVGNGSSCTVTIPKGRIFAVSVFPVEAPYASVTVTPGSGEFALSYVPQKEPYGTRPEFIGAVQSAAAQVSFCLGGPE